MKFHLVLCISIVLFSVAFAQIFLLPLTHSTNLQNFYVSLQKNLTASLTANNEKNKEFLLPEKHNGNLISSDEDKSNLEIPPTSKHEGQGRKAARQCPRCACGIPNNNRIIGGNEVHYNKYPWMAQLSYGGQFFCGGSLINDRYVLTAAHCTHGIPAQNILIRLSQFNRTKTSGILRKVSKSFIYQGYNTVTINNDIALLQLNEPVPLQGLIRPICLPHPSNTFAQTTGVVAGWGTTAENGIPSLILREVQVPIISNDNCRRTTAYGNKITQQMLCAGYRQGKKDACQGDSGGPLMVHGKTAYQQAGVVSFGYGCAQPNKPGVYTRVTEFLKWIGDHTKDACYCSTLPH